ncbi:guanosine monophosphate reductase [Natronomonas sp.]|uniref:guanosine monophosphate reductase n=1 Tax=Natronomonas sp. TaxID=2184060 RepID=UPI00397484E3
MSYQTGLSYDDVLAVPQHSPVGSRDDVDLTTELADGLELSTPVVTAAMDTVTETEMARAVGESGGLGVVHRFLPIDEQARMVREITSDGVPATGAVGIAEDHLDRAEALVDAGAALLVLDVAHGHMERTVEATAELATEFPDTPICAGNVATEEGVEDLAKAGADCVKVGVGPGSHCTTREVTGFGVPQFTAVERCAGTARERGVTTIADGGIRTSGDAVKALLVGADAVMMGGYFAGCAEAPGEVVEIDGEQFKRSRGMSTAAAAEDREDKDGTVEASEGVEALTEYTGPVEPRLREFAAGIRSGFSYAGAHDLETARENAEFMKVRATTRERNGAHGFARGGVSTRREQSGD